MDVRDLLIELFDRIPGEIAVAVDGLDTKTLHRVPEPGVNSIGWLVWHLTRVQDHHVSELLDEDQVWTDGRWAPRFGLDPDPTNTGYGHGRADVEAVRPDGVEALTGYYAEVAARTRALLDGITADDLDRIVDERWDPPVTLGVRLVSIADDDIQHAGQAAYARGLLAARG